MSDEKKSYPLGIVLLAAAVGLLVGLMTGPKLSPGYWTSAAHPCGACGRVGELLGLIDDNYVDEVDYDSVEDAMLNAMLATLDPHSQYISKDTYDREMEMMEGHFEGVGMTLVPYGDTIYAGNIIPGSPADKAGLKAGDRIMRVGKRLVSGSGMADTLSNVVNLIRGPRGSQVEIAYQHGGSERLLHAKARRDVISHTTVPAAFMLDAKTGYVCINQFSSTTGDDFHKALEELTAKGMKNLVLDLRGNGGGLLESAIAVADELLPKGQLIVYTQGAHSRRSNYRATSEGLFETGRLTLMIDESSASASEIVSGAVQDNDRGVVVGHRSFGKGLVQRQFPLSGHSAVLLTVARYYTPSGRCIQRPYDKGSDEYYADYLRRVMADMYNADSLLAPDTTQCYTTRLGRKVYGGGGILPDRVLPYFTDSSLVYYNALVSRRVIDETVCDLLFAHRDELAGRYPTADSFVRGYQVDDALWQALLAKADAKHIKRDPKSISKYGGQIRNYAKAVLAERLYGMNTYFRIILATDRDLQQALKVQPIGSRP